MPTVIEKVMFLQNLDLFSEVPTEQLAYLAAIAEEVTFATNEIIFRENDPPNAMYLVLSGRIRLHRGETEITVLGADEAFGTWALFDDQPQVGTATPVEETRLLRIAREDFIDLLSDHVQIAQGVLKAVVMRLRGLVGRVGAGTAARGNG